jgi:hypothetical protein
MRDRHIDGKWIDKKIGGHGGAFSYNSYDGKARLIYIGSTSGIKIFWYNIILWGKYVKRRLKKIYQMRGWQA